MKPYSVDLKQRVLQKLKNCTQVEVSKMCDIGVYTVKRWAKLQKETGSVSSKKPTGQNLARWITVKFRSILMQIPINHQYNFQVFLFYSLFNYKIIINIHPSKYFY